MIFLVERYTAKHHTVMVAGAKETLLWGSASVSSLLYEYNYSTSILKFLRLIGDNLCNRFTTGA